MEAIYKNIKGHRVTTDSRDIQKGDVFIALKGENFDGNKYAKDAINQGAHLAIIDNKEFLADGCMLVDDSLKFLQDIAAYHRKQLNIPILGITGTNGKTTTKELCNAVLSRKYKTYATQGNYNNHIGVPLTLLAMDETTEFGIVEMGANHLGEIKELCDIADPDYGIITNIGYAHLEGFGSYENIIATKKALYDHVIAKNGILFVNADNQQLIELCQSGKKNTYGVAGNILRGEVRQSLPFLVYSIMCPKGHLYIKTRLVGDYNFENAMAAAALGVYFKIEPLDIQAAIENYMPSNMRSQLIKTENNTLIVDAYNANPSSMQVALNNFDAIKQENKILIIGEMRELGAGCKEAHNLLIEKIKEMNISKAFLVGDSFNDLNLSANITHVLDKNNLIEMITQTPINGAIILIKGSRGNRLETIIPYL